MKYVCSTSSFNMSILILVPKADNTYSRDYFEINFKNFVQFILNLCLLIHKLTET